MTIVEELDKMSGRPHRSKNIVDAMKYAFNIEKTPQNISEAVKGINVAGGDGYLGITAATVSLTTKSIPEGFTAPNGVDVRWAIYEYDTQNESWDMIIEDTSANKHNVYSEFPVDITVPVIDGMRTYLSLYGTVDGGESMVANESNSDYTGEVAYEDYHICVTGDGACNVAWNSID